MSQSSQNTANQFLQVQFFVFLLPCYYAIIALPLRYYFLNNQQPLYHVPRLPAQNLLLSCLQDEQTQSRNSLTLAYRTPPASYIIKSKLSLLNSYLYLAMIVCSFVTNGEIFYSANHKPQSLLYFFGAAAWFLSAATLRKGHQRDTYQSLWANRIFWILAGTFSIYKLFQDYFLPLNLIFNVFFIPTNILLALYGLYRFKDKDTLELATNKDDIPSFVRTVFTTIQLNQRVRWVFNIQDQPNDNMQIGGQLTPAVQEQDYITIGQAFKHSAQAIRTQINLLQELPRRNVFVERKVHYVRQGDRQKSCFSILSQIGRNRFQSLRTIEQLQSLYRQLSSTFSPQNFPKITLPMLKTSVDQGMMGGHDIRQRAQNIQTWIDQLFKTPILLKKQVLDFLNITGQQAAPFITYFQNSYKLFCSKHYLVLLKKKQTANRISGMGARQLSGYFDKQAIQREETDHQSLMKIIRHGFMFTVQAQLDNDQSKYNFIINCLVDSKQRFNWNITKTQQQLLTINQRIQQQCNIAVPFFYQLTSKRKGKYKQQLQIYRKYIQSLLDTPKYYCTSLFFFIRFDPVKLEINTTGVRMSFRENETERRSRYLSEYQDKGTFIEVTRVDRKETNPITGEDSFKFKLRRGGLTLSGKTSQQVKQLRQRLAQLYKGVSFVPEIGFASCQKVQAKAKIQNFLLRIQNLPKIQINRDYLGFYQNSIPPKPSS